MRSIFSSTAAASLLAMTLAACGSDSTPEKNADRGPASAAAVTIPASLAPFGDGYPNAGDACRRLGEAEATREWLDDSADLVGCPTAEAAAALGGRTVATVEGITVVSVPSGSASSNAEPGAETGDGPGSSTDAMVPGTNFNATAPIRCSADGSAPTATCQAGVRRRAGPRGETFVEVTRANGAMRVLYFDGTRATGADSAEADGSAAYGFRARRQGDDTIIEYGPERYVVPDALIEGG
jgi:hypothetical protein